MKGKGRVGLEFSKYHGLGNDFLLVFEQEVTPELAVTMCNRNFGVGADGVIEINRSDRADFSFLLFNADGGIAEVSGNGLRCVGKFLYERGLHSDTTIKVEAGGGVKVLELSVQDGVVTGVRADMGAPVDQGEITLHGVVWQRISTGNPHAVTLVDDIDAAPVTTLGPLIERDPSFPDRTNVEFIKVEGDVVHARFWERGVGVTLASGTGSCASLVASGLRRATVRTLGGDLLIEWDPSGRLFMTGPAEHVFDGKLA
ncbi:MAG TPA: diaminopimelate epimerase [Actinomycetota bacterium]|nr:diaminopimelate epimerase [Actinomycetota bacterium]